MMLWRPGNQEDEEETLGLILFLVILWDEYKLWAKIVI
jgi:hypothetical protein